MPFIGTMPRGRGVRRLRRKRPISLVPSEIIVRNQNTFVREPCLEERALASAITVAPGWN